MGSLREGLATRRLHCSKLKWNNSACLWKCSFFPWLPPSHIKTAPPPHAPNAVPHSSCLWDLYDPRVVLNLTINWGQLEAYFPSNFPIAFQPFGAWFWGQIVFGKRFKCGGGKINGRKWGFPERNILEFMSWFVQNPHLWLDVMWNAMWQVSLRWQQWHLSKSKYRENHGKLRYFCV